ncbi:Uncharacterised protein [Pantoea agglomerans]|uniref:4-oxalocrotonate tautomerase-like domain-containing protein n=1 Tax=Enterobacter agglomerans TaxID=549 RepID=A0A379AL94_ENTAG|nr:Uncharacterised protein [Pantoea agglomerans]
MPLLQFDVIQGRSESELRTLLDAAHRAVLTAFKVPERDRYQIVQEKQALSDGVPGYRTGIQPER